MKIVQNKTRCNSFDDGIIRFLKEIKPLERNTSLKRLTLKTPKCREFKKREKAQEYHIFAVYYSHAQDDFVYYSHTFTIQNPNYVEDTTPDLEDEL